MDINEKILEELIQIRKMLIVLSQEKRSELEEKIKKEFLTTEQRQKMYDMFDGTKSLKEISEEIKTSSEAVRLFALSLEKAGYLDYIIINGKSKNPKKLL
jgi:hypothetical protein